MKIINEDPNKINVQHNPPFKIDGTYDFNTSGSIVFIINSDITQAFIEFRSQHYELVSKNYRNGNISKEDIENKKWDRKNGFHGRIWERPRVISFWNQPTSEQLDKIIDLLEQTDRNIAKLRLKTTFNIEISQDNNGVSNLIPIKDYLRNKNNQNNNFDLSTVHLTPGMTTQEMDAYKNSVYNNRDKKLGNISAAEYNSLKRPYSEQILHETPDNIDIYHSPIEPTDGHYRWDDKNSITFIVDKDITKSYVVTNGKSHMDILDYQIYNGDYIDDDEDNEWERKNAFHGRIWITPKVISFWKQPSPYQLIKIVNLLKKTYPEIMSNIDIINDYVIETSYDKATQKSDFKPVKDYINGNEEKTKNNFDQSIIHKTPGLTNKEMDAYKNSVYNNRDIKLGKPNNSRNVSSAEYNHYKKYGMGESKINEETLNSESIKLYHGTDYIGLMNILQDGIIDAKKGKQTGETKGMNWFFTEHKNNFSRGYMFSIEMTKEQFKQYHMHFMNNTSVANYEPIYIDKSNFKIEEAFNIPFEQLLKMWEILKNKNKDIDNYELIFKLIEVLEKSSIVIDKEAISINNDIFIQIMKQIIGENNLRQYGILESVINDVRSDDINLNSFKPKEELNPKFWVNNKLNSRVRLRLLDITDNFIDELSTGWVKPKDVVFTGSLANYNWSKYSDIDIHILIDYDDVYKDHDFVEDYFKSKKDLWLDEHPELKIYGYPVEIYVEDINNKGTSTGIYSLYKNKWLKEPGDIQDAKLNEEYIKRNAAKLMNEIDLIEKKLNNETDEHKIEILNNKLKRLANKIKKIRVEGLKNDQNEMSSGNIIYKILRRTKYIDKLYLLLNSSYDKVYSLSESIIDKQIQNVVDEYYKNWKKDSV